MPTDTSTKYYKTGNCCCCKDGQVIDRWQNVSKVRPAGDSGGTHYTATPYARLDRATDYPTTCGDGADTCPTSPNGTCGPWLVGGDLNGLPTHDIDATVDDIMTCAANDSTHASKDHNCYTKSGTVDMRATRKGFQSVLARKHWHGRFPFLDNDLCGKNPNLPPTQIKYLTIKSRTDCYTETFDVINTNPAEITDQKCTQTVTVNNLTGIITKTQTGELNGTSDGATADCELLVRTTAGNVTGTDLSDLEANMHSTLPDYGDPYPFWSPGPDRRTGAKLTIISSEFSPIHFLFTWDYINVGITGYYYEHREFELDLSNPYTSADVLEHWKQAIAEWDMSDFNLSALRTDEYLALSPVCLYDEVGPLAPSADFNSKMDDLNSPITDANGVAPWKSTDPAAVLPYVYDSGVATTWIPTWTQIDWKDPNDFVWKWGDYYSQPSGIAYPAVTMVYPMRTGEVISHTQAGSDRHFWFDAGNWRRIHQLDSAAGCMDTGMYLWQNFSNGAFSESPLPSVTMRWQNKREAQWDGYDFTNAVYPAPGNLPQAWLREYGGTLWGGKYVEAAQTWDAVNYGRPCGRDKYAIDQTTVCCITTNAAPVFTVDITTNAVAPLAAGGLSASDYIGVENDGVYQINSITGTGPWVLNCTRIDNFPAVYSFRDPDEYDDGYDHVGRLRFPTAYGICGRETITTSFDSGTGLVTIEPATSLPWLRMNPVTGNITVDIYDSSMAIVLSSVNLTRVSDTSFTFSHAAIPTAYYMTGAGVDWSDYGKTPQRSGVKLEWTFNQRAQDPAYSVTPTWYAGIGGCISGTVEQFTYIDGKCKSIVGIVPYYLPSLEGDTTPTGDSTSPIATPVESFKNQVLFAMPDVFLFDDVFGAVWMGAVEMNMPDPFWQTPFVPSCDSTITSWNQDNGSGQADALPAAYYAHSPMVEAAKNVPSGKSLPSGIHLYYDTSVYEIAPPYYPNGIPIPDNSCIGLNCGYLSVERPWGLSDRICSATRFLTDYASWKHC